MPRPLKSSSDRQFTPLIGLGELPTPDDDLVDALRNSIRFHSSVPLMAKQVILYLIDSTRLRKLALASFPETTFGQSDLVDIANGCRDISKTALFERLGTGARITVRRGVHRDGQWRDTGSEGAGLTVFIGYEDRVRPLKSVLTPGTTDFPDVVVTSFAPTMIELRRIRASF